MNQLLVSGILYSPLRECSEEHAKIKHLKTFKNKLPIPIKDQSEKFNVGKILQIKTQWYKNLPVYYLQGILTDVETITEVLCSAMNSAYYYHSWCAAFDYKYDVTNDWMEETNPVFGKFNAGLMCRTPCIKFAHLFIPFASEKINNKLIALHREYHKGFSRQDYKDFKEIRMTDDKYVEMFDEYRPRAKEIDYSKILNFKLDD